MKILLINKFYYPCGGTEKYLRALEVLLKKHGHEVFAFSMQDPRNWPSEQAGYFADPVDVRRFNFGGIIKTFHNRDANQKLKKLIEKIRPDIAHLHNISHHLSPAIIPVLKNAGIPVVQTLHDYRLVCPNRVMYAKSSHCERCAGGRYYQCALNRCVQRSWAKSILASLEAYWHHTLMDTYGPVGRFIAPSRYMKEAVVRFGVDAGKVAVVNNFLEQSELDRLDAPAAPGRDYLLYFGRLEEEKGIDILIRAWPLVPSPCRLVLAGQGPDRERLSRLAAGLGVADRVDFAGFKQGQELDDMIAGAKAALFPSRWAENMPYSLMEALARGKAVIAARSGGLPEFVRHGHNGFLFEAGNAAELAGLINSLDRCDLPAIGRRARQSALRYNEDRHYGELMGVYDRVMLEAEGR